MTYKDKIKSEIVRRRKIVKNSALQMKDAEKRNHYLKMVEEYDDILRYIDTSPSEPVSEIKKNEAKSKFVYPDKLYARTNDNITIDVSYAPQTLEAVEYTRTDAFIEKACEWFRRIDYDDTIPPYETTEEFIEEFKKAMEL